MDGYVVVNYRERPRVWGAIRFWRVGASWGRGVSESLNGLRIQRRKGKGKEKARKMKEKKRKFFKSKYSVFHIDTLRYIYIQKPVFFPFQKEKRRHEQMHSDL